MASNDGRSSSSSVRNEPTRDMSQSADPYQPLLSEEPVPRHEDPAQPLVSREPVREPVEDEYLGFLEIESSDEDSKHFELEPEAKLLPSQHRSEPSRPIHRIDSIEARMETYERFKNLTRRQLTECMEQVEELKDDGAGRHEKEKQMEERITYLETKVKECITLKDEALAEAAHGDAREQVVKEALEQAEKERKQLPEYAEVNKKLKEMLGETCEKLEQTKEELDEAKKKEIMSEQENAKLRSDRSTLEMNRAIQRERIENQEKKLREQEEKYQLLEKVLQRLEERCDELEEENERLHEGNTYTIIEDTVFKVIKVGSPTAETATGGAPLGVMLECFSCHTLYYPSENNDVNSCQFHPLPAMHYREWRRWPIAAEASAADRKKYYWPCCDILSDLRPVGCFEGRHHQHWEMDILMKTVLLSKENLEWFEPRT
ncbi:uncharacterized protein [Amphiura filiformis]|uniref:uncharacterized protein n=1 Tax=Amphiura filiformis TaxID=82378 RepID=UPI003B21AAB5